MGMDPTQGINFVNNQSPHIRSVDGRLNAGFNQGIHEAGGAIGSMAQEMFYQSGWGWEGKDSAVAYAKPGKTETGQAAPAAQQNQTDAPPPLALNQPPGDPNGIVGQTVNVKGA